MNNYVNKGTLLIAILIFGIGTFLIPILTDAFSLSLSANAKVWSPWYTSETKAKGSVSWQHPQWLGGLIVPHTHHGFFSCYARVGANEAQEFSNVYFWLSSLNGTVNTGASRTDSGHPRWDGDAYASGSISENNNPSNWAHTSS